MNISTRKLSRKLWMKFKIMVFNSVILKEQFTLKGARSTQTNLTRNKFRQQNMFSCKVEHFQATYINALNSLLG